MCYALNRLILIVINNLLYSSKLTEAVDQLSFSSADQPLVKPSSPRPTLSSVSKSLVMARGLAKLRKRLTTDDGDQTEGKQDLTSSLGDNNISMKKRNLSPSRRVQFNEASYSQEQEDVNDNDADNE